MEIIAFISIHLNKEIYEEVLIQEKNNQKLLKYINNSNIDNIKKLVQNSGLLDKIYVKKKFDILRVTTTPSYSLCSNGLYKCHNQF